MVASHSLPGTPSDEASDIPACGRQDTGTLFLSMAERHPGGEDADYLRWHTLDHRPEQQRLAGLRTSLRVVSTPACRAARAAADPSFNAVDHVMTYFFSDEQALAGFGELSAALQQAGRSPFILSPVQRGVYTVCERLAAPGVTAGADVLPWVPARGLYLLLEQGGAVPDAAPVLASIDGVSGVWDATSGTSSYADAPDGQRLHLCFLDADPVEVAGRLRPVLEARWRPGAWTVLLAAPFYSVVPYEWDRYLP